MSDATRKQTPASGAIPPAEAVDLKTLVTYVEGSVVSRAIVQKPIGTVTLFAFDAGQGLSEHTAPFDALVQGLDGEAELTIGGKPVRVGPGRLVRMPAGVPHALKALTRFTMMLVMIRG
jgi:quercetin dioxygenase-like cupin family protein